MNDLRDEGEERKVAVVTGASSGIGYELAKQFAKQGYDLVIAAENEDIFIAAMELERWGHYVQPVRVNLATREGVETLYSKIKIFDGIPEAMAINASIGMDEGFKGPIDIDDEINLIKLYVISSVRLAKLALADMIPHNRGYILFTSSITSLSPGPYLATYHASKAFIQSFAEGIQNELRDTNIVVTSLMPSPTDVNSFQRGGPTRDSVEAIAPSFSASMPQQSHHH